MGARQALKTRLFDFYKIVKETQIPVQSRVLDD